MLPALLATEASALSAPRKSPDNNLDPATAITRATSQSNRFKKPTVGFSCVSFQRKSHQPRDGAITIING
jgi:hypothetical protein